MRLVGYGYVIIFPDRYRFDADPDPTFYFDAYPGPDARFHIGKFGFFLSTLRLSLDLILNCGTRFT